MCSVDNLEIYNYIHHNIFFSIHIIILWHWLNIKSEDWKEDRLMVIDNMFEWLFKLNFTLFWLTSIISDEYDMYSWHLWEVNEHQNYDWLQNMFYNIIQQTVHQLSVYYIVYVALQRDHNWQLIFYSYYVKYQDSADKIFFWHINLNILQLVNKKRDKNLIQEFILLNTEHKNDCTEMLLDMHHHLDV